MADRVPGSSRCRSRAARTNTQTDRDERAHTDSTPDRHTSYPDGDGHGHRAADIHSNTNRRAVVGGRFSKNLRYAHTDAGAASTLSRAADDDAARFCDRRFSHVGGRERIEAGRRRY